MAFPVEERLVVEAEAALGRALPAAWRARLLRENGGELELDDEVWQVFPVRDPSDRRRLARTASHLVRETAVAREWNGFPREAVALASDGSGNLLVLLPGDELVKRWDHETGEVEDVALETY